MTVGLQAMRVKDPPSNDELEDALRVLFNILDSNKTGKVSYEKLCQRFGEVQKPFLPPTFLNCVGKVSPSNGFISFEQFLNAVKLSLRDNEVNNNISIYRVNSEGRINHNPSDKKRMAAPTMGINGYHRRSQIYTSQPSIYQQQNNANSNYAPLPRNNMTASSYSNLQDYIPSDQNVVMRQKKVNTVRSQKEEHRMRHPLPPNGVTPRVQVIRSRPHSTASYNSLASSGLENIAWRGSSRSTSTADSQPREDEPRVAKLESLQREEADLIRRGNESAARLTQWYNDKLQSIEKKSRLLNQGMVALDPAVHEQKLNFLRAHVMELNRRIVSLMETSEKGFPTHVNLQKNNLPQPQDDQLLWLHRQNRELNEELGDKTRQIEELKRERDEREDRARHAARAQSRPQSLQARPSAFVRPAVYIPIPTSSHSSSPVKIYDTLM